MTTDLNGPSEVDGVLRNVWASAADADIDADCSPTRVCRNAREFTFDGIGDGESDLATSWRKLLEREGKLSTDDTPSIRDLVLGSSND
jgi:hypothetical protein